MLDMNENMEFMSGFGLDGIIFSVEFFLLCRVLSDVDYALFVSIRPFT